MDILITIIIFSIILYIIESITISYRKDKLIKKYGDEEVAEKIIERLIWQGQTEEQLLDSVGKPTFFIHDYQGERVKEIWRYEHSIPKHGRFRSFGDLPPDFEVFIENSKVVSWELMKKTRVSVD